MTDREILLIYDAECPVCDYYARSVRIPASVGDLKRVNARESTAVMKEISRAGFDIDQGMVLKIEDELFFGADAMHALASIASPSSRFGRAGYWIYRSRFLSRSIYPLLRFSRAVLLRALGRKKIQDVV